MKRTIGWVVVAAGLGVAMLDGCVVPLVGAAAVGGSVVATDRRPVGIQVEDKAIESRVNAALIRRSTACIFLVISRTVSHASARPLPAAWSISPNGSDRNVLTFGP